MTDLRTTAQQALEAMESAEVDPHSSDAVYKAITALKAALVEDAMQKFTDVNQELQAALGCDHCNSPLYAAIKCRVCGRVTEPVQEPVANRAFLERILTAMEGVIDVADRKTDEFDALRSCVIDLTLMLHTAPPQREPVQEPVAWMFVDDTGMRFVSVDRPHKHCQPLYTAPPQRPAEATTIAEWWADKQRKPLTEEEIQAAWDSVDMRHPRGNETRIAFARAIEQAHRIV